MPKKIEEMKEYHRMHHGKKGIAMLILGILILINAYYRLIGWDSFIGALLIIGGILRLIMPKRY